VIGVSGTVLDAAAARGRAIPVTSVNRASYPLATGALDEQQVALLETTRATATDRMFDRVRALPGIKLETVVPGAPRNASAAHPVPIEPLLAAHGGRGAFV